MPLPSHIPLNQLGASETSPGRSSPFAGPSQHRHTTSLMQELSAEDLDTDAEAESGEHDMGDDGEEREMKEWEREAAQSRSGEDMAEDMTRWNGMSPFVLIPRVFTSRLPVKPQAVERIYLISLSKYLT